MTDPAAIGFQFCFAGTSSADPAAQTRQCRRGADETRHQILQLRELDLQLAFARARAPGKDVENQLRSIDDFRLESFLEIPQLRRRQLVVEDDDVDIEFVAGSGERLNLAATEKCRGVRLRPLLQHAQHDHGAGR